MIKFDEFEKLQHGIDRLERDKERDIGALEQLMKQLKKEHGCTSKEEALQLIKKLRRQFKRDTARLQTSIKRFRRKYKNELASLEEED